MDHSKYFSASASSRWLECQPSVMGERLPEGDTTAADEGTMGHHFSEFTLRDRMIAMKAGADPLQFRVERYLGKKHAGTTLGKQHLIHLQGYVDYVWSLVVAGGLLYIENRVNYDQPLNVHGLSEVFRAFGTADCLVVMPDGTLFVIDLKFGLWDVDAEANTQQALYAIGGYRKLRLLHNITRFVFIIYQPRTSGPPADQWNTSFDFLEKITKKARKAAAVIVSLVEAEERGEEIPIRLYKPSLKNCEFCKKAKCSVRRKSWSR